MGCMRLNATLFVICAALPLHGQAAAQVAVTVASTPVATRYGLQGAVKGPDGRLYAAANDKHRSVDASPALFAFNPDGSMAWSRVLYPRYLVGSRAAITADGHIHLMLTARANEGGHDPSTLFTFNLQGEDQWSINLDPWYQVKQTVRANSDGVVFVSAFSRRGDDPHPSALVAIEPNGFLRWRYAFRDNVTPLGIQIGATPGRLFMTADNPLDNQRAPSRLLVIQDQPGFPQVTEVPVSRRLQLTTPVLMPDGGVVVAANHRYMGSPGGLFRFDADGRELWYREFDPKFYARNHVTVGKDGTIYVPLSIRRPNDHDEPMLLALDDAGNRKWSTPIERWNELNAQVVLAADGTVAYLALTNLIGGTDNRSSLVAVNVADGSMRWKRDLPRYTQPTLPVPGVAGVVYLAVDNPGVENPSAPSQLLRFAEVQ